MVNIGGATTAKEVHERGISLPFSLMEVQRYINLLVQQGAAYIENKRVRKIRRKRKAIYKDECRYKLKKEFYDAAKTVDYL